MSTDVPSGTVEDFAHMWAWFATHCQEASPIYERISLAVAGDRELLERLRTVPPSGHLPPALLAAVHDLVLSGADQTLADLYTGRAEGDPGPPFLDFCRSHWTEVDHLLSTRHIQTNDCGRSALIAPGLTWLAPLFGGRFSLVDVGASAGLNLQCDNYRIDYGSFGATGPADSPVVINCRVAGGDPPIAERLPTIVTRVGIDRSPIDLTDADDVRWLLACVWPDSGRLERTAASIELAQQNPPRVIAADANAALPDVLAGLPTGTAAVIVTTWAFAYFSIEERQEFIALLDAASHQREIAWLSAEGTGTVEPVAEAAAVHRDLSGSDVLGAVLFKNGSHRGELLGFVGAHGAWIDWRATAESPIAP
jgi:hypothetical protein